MGLDRDQAHTARVDALERGFRGVAAADLRQVDLFCHLDEGQADHLARHTVACRLKKGEEFFRHGEPAWAFFWLASGLIKLYRLSSSGQEKVLELVRPGDTIGESLLFAGGEVAYPVHAQAVETSEVLAVSLPEFRRVLHNSADAAFELMGRMSRRLHQQFDEIDRLTLHDATYRLVSYLLEQLPPGVVQSPNVCLSTSKHLVASRLSIQPETFSRILKRLAGAGLIEVDGSTIVIRDIPGLHALIH